MQLRSGYVLNTGSGIGLRSRSASGLRFGLVRVRVNSSDYICDAVLRKKYRRTGAMSVTFRAAIVSFGITEK